MMYIRSNHEEFKAREQAKYEYKVYKQKVNMG